MIDLPALLDHLQLSSFRPTVLSGGSIHEVYRLQERSQSYLLKISEDTNGNRMLEAEIDGLQAIEQTKTIRVPKPIRQGTFGNTAYFVMEYIPNVRPFKDSFGVLLGHQLADLHRNSNTGFGYHRSNYIGSLPQSNSWQQNWPDFYLEERLLPQYKLARNAGYFTKDHQEKFDQFLHSLPERLPDESPSLLHGDLWSGNYLVTPKGIPALIDPAVYYGHREVDLAMSLLFGGFPENFYQAYQEAYPLSENWQQRIPVYQLYYLLVHVNLFGWSYVSASLEVITTKK